MRTIPWVLAGGLLLSVAAGADTDLAQPRWSDPDACPVTQTEVQEWLQQQRVVLIGERHDAYAHHQVQLDLIRALDRAQPDTWALGLEFVQQPFQDELDAYVAGTL
ncbi:MAG: ChaN family lipoprotein, partial [Candidatus Competibacterales bacterium]|nr:ChaN family lipoprotein [Candidatus Competibacterales bacterium]